MGQWWVSRSCSRCGPGEMERKSGREGEWEGRKIVEKCTEEEEEKKREQQIGIERVKGVGKKRREKSR